MAIITTKPEEVIVAALTRNRVIGAGGRLPWHCSEELRLFRRLTLGGTVVLGRRTYESIGHPLEGRRNIVVSTTLALTPGIEIAPSFDAAVALALATPQPVFYCGGAQIYGQALARADSLCLSWMQREYAGDVFFPAIDFDRWEVVSEEAFGEFVRIRYQRRVTNTE